VANDDISMADAAPETLPTLNGKSESHPTELSQVPSQDATIPSKLMDQPVSEPPIVHQPTSIARDEPMADSKPVSKEDIELKDATAGSIPNSPSPSATPKPDKMDISQPPPEPVAEAKPDNLEVNDEDSMNIPLADHKPASTQNSTPQPTSTPQPSSFPQPDSTNSFTAQPSDTVATQTSGQVRPREDESDVEPSAKRPKIDEMEIDKPTTPGVPTPTADTGTPAPASQGRSADFDSNPMTEYQKKYLLDSVRKTKKIKAATVFLLPVDPVALNIPKYPEIITNPMDLSTMEEKLKTDKYPTANDLWADLVLMVNNSIKFNGEQHAVSQQGQNLQAYFHKLMQTLPKRDANHEAKKVKPPPAAPVRQVPPRRESRQVTAPKPAPQPVSSKEPEAKPQLDSYGTPLIRRESQVDRPKREIVKPVRDLPYSNSKPKKKNVRLDLRFCEWLNKELLKPKYKNFNWPFVAPVDTVALNIPQYHRIIKKPMDFGTMADKLGRGEYKNANQYHEDAELVFQNCFTFNAANDNIHYLGKQLEGAFDDLWAKKDQWINDNAPQSEPASEEEDSEEEDVEENDNDKMQRMLEIQKQIAALSAEAMQLSTGAPKDGSKKAKSKDRGASGSKKQKRSSLSASTKVAKVKKPKKPRKLTLDEKRYVSEGIGQLDEPNMRKAVQIIRNGVPSLRVRFPLLDFYM
jgi:bromodomain-containing factor 1